MAEARKDHEIVTSPASSGPAGPHFEGQVGGHYLLSMLAGAEPRGLPGCATTSIKLQGAPEGHSLDDVVVNAHDMPGREVTLEIQVKRSITFAPSDEVFRSVMTQVAHATRNPTFWTERRELAVAIAKTSHQIDSSYQDVLTWARELGDAKSFHARLKLPKVASKEMRRFVATFTEHLKANGVAHDEETVWALLRRFQILVFDFTTTGSASEELAKERATRVLTPDYSHKAADLWQRLVGLSIQVAASGGDRTRDQLLQELADGYQFVALPRHQTALAVLAESSRHALADIDDRVAGIRLSRQAHLRELHAARDRARYLDIRGDAGVGKSGILRYFAEQISSESRVIVFSPNRTYPRGWANMRHALGFSGTCRELLSELSANGGGVIFVDNLDFFSVEERPTVVDVLREAATVPGMVVVTTARRDFGVTDRSWLPSDALDQLGRTTPISIGEIDGCDVDELRDAAPHLSQLLRDNHPARAVIRNLFRLSQLAVRPAEQPLPRTEAEMAAEWWRQADSVDNDGRRLRARLLKMLAESALSSTGQVDVSQTPHEAVDALVESETLIDLGSDHVVFRHDVFREWAVGNLLFIDADAIQQLPLNRPAPPDLARAVELLACMRIENASSAESWASLIATFGAEGVHGTWRRAALLALVRSEAGLQILTTARALLLGDDGKLLCEVIRLTMAVDVEPAKERFAAAGIDPAAIPASLNIPSGPSWLRLILWIYGLGDELPPGAIPDVVKVYAGWCVGTMGGDNVTPLLIERMYQWLRQIEVAREGHQHWDDPGVFSGRVTGHQLKVLEEDLRTNFLSFSNRAPHLAVEYLDSFKTRSYSDDIRIGILKFRGALAQAAPSELVEFTLSTLTASEKTEGRRNSRHRRERPFEYTDSKFIPASPAQGPFFELLTSSPQQGMSLIRRLVDYSISFYTDNATASDSDGVSIRYSSGERFFPWIRTYVWSRDMGHAPYLVTSALMALEAWAHRRIENDEAFELVIADVIGPEGGPMAFLLIAVDLILSHWPNSQLAAVPYLGSPELLCLDRSRFAADNTPELPDLFGLKELQQEPLGVVNSDSLKNRPSRRLMLDQLLRNYAFPPEPAMHETLKALLQEASARLAPPSDASNFGDPEFMVIHALNTISPSNWPETVVSLPDGTTTVVRHFVAPPSEAERLALLEAELIDRDSAKSMRRAIRAAVGAPQPSADDFLRQALAWVRREAEGHTIEEDADLMPGTVPAHEQDLITTALLIARDSSSTMRSEHGKWIREVLALSFSEKEEGTHRYRSEYQFNPQAYSFVGIVCLLKHEATPGNIRLLLEAASHSNPSAADGLKAAGAALVAIDERIIQSVLRCAFTARIVPARDWGINESEEQSRKKECKRNIALRIDTEIAWLTSSGPEPQWPLLPQEKPTLRNGIRLRHHLPEEGEEAPPREQYHVEAHGAAMWLKAASGLFDVALRPWLRDLAAAYREWTVVANGAGIDKDEQIDGEPNAWNEEYFKLAAFCLAAISPSEISGVVSNYFALLPDETLYDNAKIFLRNVDAVFFNLRTLTSDVAVQIRALIANLLRGTRGWNWLKTVRVDSAEMHISAVVSTLFFNEESWLLPSKCYLTPAAIPRVTVFLGVFRDVASDCRCPLIASVALNLLEVSPQSEHLSFLVTIATAWMETYADDVRFWIEFQIGRRVCTLVEQLLKLGLPVEAKDQATLGELDSLLGSLIRLGVPEAHRLEELLRTLR